MRVMARRLLTVAVTTAILGLTGPAIAQPVREQPRAGGISAYVMTVLDMFCGGMRGAMISLFVRGEARVADDPLVKEELNGGKGNGRNDLEEIAQIIPLL